MALLKTILIAILVYLLIAYSLRWLEVSNQPEYVEQHPQRSMWQVGWKAVGLFLLEYLYVTIHLIFLVIDYAIIPLRRFSRSIPATNPGSRPVLLVHGYMMRAGTMWWLGFCLQQEGRRVCFFNYSPPWEDIEYFANQLKQEVDKLLSQQPEGKVDLVAHSMGGLVCRYYITQLGGWERVEHLVTLGAPHQGSMLWSFALWRCGREMRPGSPLLQALEAEDHLLSNLQTTAIYTDFDELVIPQPAAMLPYPWVRNKKVSGIGHVGYLFSPKVFRLIEKALEA